ncbi:FERM domain-containing protein 3 isoform X2 [Musca domestica]|uniref:Moesin/ezrin/radixin homolog 1 n=1 Tax=Musca domestica TaxID=7370 RepID=A0ABM3VJY6_MUSDO|nr:FERM domain-containing protein 3 isoform X2 [Musca domestica]
MSMFKSKNEGNIYKCTVRLLDDTELIECEFQQWLDLGKPILKQIKDLDPMLFSFRVKFYPADPFRLTNQGRTMLYQQLKRDLRHGRIYCSVGEAAALGSLIVQEELGDYNEEIHVENYVASMNLALRQTESLERKIIELHKKREPRQNPSEVVNEFLSIVSSLETYGIDPHPVKDHRGSQLYIGINYTGISTFICGKRSQHFRWNEVQKINFEGKMFIAHLSYTDASREAKKHTVGFKCSTNSTCRYLWRCALEQMLFFTLPNSQNAAVVSGGGFFSWGTKFKYTGRTEREILTESINALREQKLNSSGINNRKASSVPATPSSPPGDFEQIRYSSLPRSTMSEPLTYCKVPGSDCAHNIVLYQGQGYGDTDTPIIQLPCLEPVSEESKLIYSSKLNKTNHDSINYYLRCEDNVVYSPTMSKPSATELNKNNKANLDSSKTYLLNKNIDNSVFGSTKIAQNIIHQKSSKSAKPIRKFRFINAFIPSVMCVIILMTVFAIFVIESKSNFLQNVRNLPEMISLRYQYYQPLKEYVFSKLGIKF